MPSRVAMKTHGSTDTSILLPIPPPRLRRLGGEPSPYRFNQARTETRSESAATASVSAVIGRRADCPKMRPSVAKAGS